MFKHQIRFRWVAKALALAWLGQASAQAPAIVDKDSDGLIDINNLDDLNEIRNNLTGTSLRGSNAGCPASGCFGFELTRDLNFDSNGDGQITGDDWNFGRSWTPIQGTTPNVPSDQNRFRATFEGNGHAIRNLRVRRITNVYDYGLFGSVTAARIRSLRLPAVDVNIQGDRNNVAGALAGRVFKNSRLHAIIVDGDVISDSQRALGGLAAMIYESEVGSCSFSGEVTQLSASALPYPDVGGLFGYAQSSTVGDASTRGVVSGAYAAGLVNTLQTTGVNDSFTNVEVRARISGAGLANRAFYGIEGIPTAVQGDPDYYRIENVYALGPVNTGTNNGGGLLVQIEARDGVSVSIRNSYSKALITNTSQGEQWSNLVQFVNGVGTSVDASYWVIDPAGAQLPANSNLTTGGQLLVDMQCATTASSPSCGTPDLFRTWGANWSFGTTSELPAVMRVVQHRWVSGDTPNATGDHESLSSLLTKFPEDSCAAPLGLEAKEQNSPYRFFTTPTEEKLEFFSATQGLVCRNAQQTDGVCEDYRVRYLCDETSAGGTVRWTARTSSDTPTTGDGDDERLAGAGMCTAGSPIGIEATNNISTHYRVGPTRKLAYFSTTRGLACLNADGACKDHLVRMVCRVVGDR